jgi:2-polyprenyl-6-methoxyphenol hydroxylase-like FAD-dependent oxidoreductase
MSTRHTTLLIVGAGPTGLAAALSLVKNGFRDFIIVDEILVRPPSSRAMTLHAATLEALEQIDCADTFVKLGIKGEGMRVSDRTSPLLGADFSSLDGYTKYPYVLIVPQTTTEHVLESRLNELGISVVRPEKAVGLKSTESGDLQVTFESGNVVTARYIIGADGAKSVIRQMAGVNFTDPDGQPPDERLAQIVFADVVFFCR